MFKEINKNTIKLKKGIRNYILKINPSINKLLD